jgi:hypothetical protein
MATEINVKAPKANDREWTGSYDFGANLDEAKEKFGEDVVFSSYVSAQTIRAQAVVRSLLEAGKTDDEIAVELAAWKPGVQRTRSIDPQAAILAKWSSMSQEDKAAFLAKLQQAG